MAFMMRFGFYPEEFLSIQYDKALLVEEWMKKNDEDLKKEIKENWKKWLSSYLKETVSQLGKDNEKEKERLNVMEKANPVFNLRNYLLEESIRDARLGKYDKVNLLLKLSEDPFNRDYVKQYPELFKVVPHWAKDLCVSCSS